MRASLISRPRRGHLAGQVGVFRRIDARQAAGQHGQRPAARLQGGAVGGPVDPAGQSADDRVAGAGQAGGEPVRHAPAVGGAVPRADQGDGVGVLQAPECRGVEQVRASPESPISGGG